ncbi:hypothetical protein QAD02_004693 [Eretmocerus hayati]|uniref:Uncharacterized protein n=1 Tax=Eretmocerus hayati TaxID=131215 RepID=A0ACC2NQN2_9HYME|nr:hypothetical protein QAD02_004693 [Eretmocerus hayati]
MNGFVFLLICALTLIGSLYGDQDGNYDNLDKIGIDNLSILESLGRLGRGGLKFLVEGTESLNNEIKDITPRNNQEYDFVVVGAGSAGSAVAARLSENKDVTVLLIEAGRPESLLMDIPVLVNYLQFSNDINWKYQTEPSNKYCLGMKNHQCNWPRGKVMGGSSVLNYMIATRGNKRDYDTWAEMGNEGWSYANLTKYFKRLEAIGIPELQNDEEMHNTKGPVHISYPPYHTPLAEGFLKAGREMGYRNIDYNGRESVGFSYIQSTMKNGTRMSTNRAYLYPIKGRKNLFVTKYSRVNKILIDPKTKRAYGVKFTKFLRNIQVKARKEIILCAGAIGSPQILMLSGVGPSKHLKEMGIKVIQDAPVGENLMDHIAYGGLVFLANQSVSIATKELIDIRKSYIRDFLTYREGPLTVPGGCEALAFIDVDKPNDANAYPNVELLFIGASIVSDPFLHLNFGISNKYWSKMYARISGRHSWTIFPMLMRPKSRGRILLRNSSPRAKPKIFANYLDHPEDIRIMIEGIRSAIEVSKTKAMQKFGSELHDVPVLNCEHLRYDSDEYWECAIRTFTVNIYHYSGTCKMAPKSDPTGVVDPRLRVKGIKGLRVADASIMPSIITGHPNIPVIMIAEKLAAMVKADMKKDELSAFKYTVERA